MAVNSYKNWQYDTYTAARSVAAKLRCKGAHKMSNGKYMPCKNHQHFLSYYNKYIDTSVTYTLAPSSFETIDVALYNWLNEELDIHVDTNSGFKKVNIIWLTAERAHQIKNIKEIRDNESEALVFPLISVERTNVSKLAGSERPIPAILQPNRDSKTPRYYLKRKIVQGKTRNFANATSLRLIKQEAFPTPANQRVVYESSYVPLPIFYDVNYTINIRTDYQQQMNDILLPFTRERPGYFIINNQGHKYEAFIQENYAATNNISSLGSEEKKYETSLTIKVKGYVLDKGDNQKGPKVLKRQNQVKIRFPRERVLVGDVNEYGDGTFVE